jgi:hypothetical protein
MTVTSQCVALNTRPPWMINVMMATVMSENKIALMNHDSQ